MTTASLPRSWTPWCLSSLMIPLGVQGRKYGFPLRWVSLPMFSVVSPSTSFSGAIASVIALSSMWEGKGSWIMMDWTVGSLLMAAILWRSAAWEMSAGRCSVSVARSQASAARCFMRT